MEQGGYFEVPFRVPSLNDYIKANRTNKYAGAKFKKDVEKMIGVSIMKAVAEHTLMPCKTQCEVYFTWTEENKKRDADNIQSGQKYILDALQMCGILKNDNRRYVKNTYHKIVDVKGTSKVRVDIKIV